MRIFFSLFLLANLTCCQNTENQQNKSPTLKQTKATPPSFIAPSPTNTISIDSMNKLVKPTRIIYTCAQHPDVRSSAATICHKCGKKLTQLNINN